MLDQICRQGRSYWVHLLMASQDIDTRAEKLLENVGYRLVLRANTPASASAAGVPSAVNLPREVGLGYMRPGSAENTTKFRSESLWRDYRKPGARHRRRHRPCRRWGSITLSRNCSRPHFAPLPGAPDRRHPRPVTGGSSSGAVEDDEDERRCTA